jgi:hypothetical protein
VTAIKRSGRPEVKGVEAEMLNRNQIGAQQGTFKDVAMRKTTKEEKQVVTEKDVLHLHQVLIHLHRLTDAQLLIN